MPDREDSVPLAEKASARQAVGEILPVLARHHRVAPRINSLDGGLAEQDLRALVSPSLWAVVLVIAETLTDILRYDVAVGHLEAGRGLPPGGIQFIVLLESAKGILDARPILTASPRIVAGGLGGEDYTADMGIQRTDDGVEMLMPRVLVALACRAADVWPLDTVYVQFRNSEGLRKDVGVAKTTGMRGKFAIHPAQVEIINEAFAPSPGEVEHARRVVEGYADAEAKGLAAFALDGKMVDIPAVKRAQAVLALASADAPTLGRG